MQVNESSENYLETILVLSKRNPVVRSVDIAEELGFKKSSVSVAMKNLREKNNITVTKEGYIYLTDSGREIAEMIYERHELLTDWLTRLGVDRKLQQKMHAVWSMSSAKKVLMRSKNILNNLIHIHLYISTSFSQTTICAYFKQICYHKNKRCSPEQISGSTSCFFIYTVCGTVPVSSHTPF